MNQQEQVKHRISIPKYTLGEELISAISHGVGALLGIAALVLCIVKSCNPFDGYKLASSIVYGLTVTLLYLMSCLYHSLKVNKAKRVFRVIDHCTIFLLIAGTYTPYTLVALRGTLGWWIFGIIWGIAILGIVLNAVNLKKFAKLSVACYLIMGWIIVFAYQYMVQVMHPTALSLLIWGGIAYTVGAVLYAIGSKKKYFHSVFHFFCLAGTILHFFSIYLYVL
ncbi:MAG: hemolysin III family protein [Eubacteriales bacterium]|nr:hemolysin III family protein [Eubacteriales bacterium]